MTSENIHSLLARTHCYYDSLHGPSGTPKQLYYVYSFSKIYQMSREIPHFGHRLKILLQKA